MSSPTVSEERDERFMRRAIGLARHARELGEVPVGAVLVDAADRIVAEAGNAPITQDDPTAHAEMLALREAGQALGNYRLPDTTLYVTLEPCPMCAGALVHARVSRLVFAAADPRTGACGSVFNLVEDPRMNHQVVVKRGLLALESAALLEGFFAERRKQAP